jgi:hypothetical protein
MVYEYRNIPRIIAFVQWTSQVSEDKYGLKMFKGFGSKQFIDVCVIDRCIGFLKVDNIYYIIDKEVNDLDDSNLYTSYTSSEEE